MAEIKVNVPVIEKLLDYSANAVGVVPDPILANWKAHEGGRARLTSARYDADI